MKRRRKDRKPESPTPTPLTAEAAEVERPRRENERLRKQLGEQAKRIADLERQLALKQQNSPLTSKPPSSDGLAGQQRARGRRGKSRRKVGGQPGHRGAHRAWCSSNAWTPSWISRRMPAASVRAACTRGIPSAIRAGIRLTELPPITAHITEYRCHRRQCPACDTITAAALPDGHVTQFGPQLTALIVYLTVVCRMPRLVVQRFLEGALQIPISLGSTQHAWEEASTAVAAPYAELAAALRQEPVPMRTRPAIGRTARNAGCGRSSRPPSSSIALPRRAGPTCSRPSSATPLPASLASC